MCGHWAGCINLTVFKIFSCPGLYFDLPEIVPDGLQGEFRFNRSDEPAVRFASAETEVRALVEGQMLAKRLHAETVGFSVTEESRILVTGGASVNSAILQVIADVFNAGVFTQPAANSAALGGAYRALAASPGNSFALLAARLAESCQQVAEPSRDAALVYGPLLERYRRAEQAALKTFAVNSSSSS